MSIVITSYLPVIAAATAAAAAAAAHEMDLFFFDR